MSKPLWLPEVRQFSQQQDNVVQRPQGVDAVGVEGLKTEDIVNRNLELYAEMQASPGRMDDLWAFPINPQALYGGEVILVEKDLAFTANTLLVDNWTNQWLFEPNLRRYIPPYSGGWVISSPKGFQKIKMLVRAPVTFTPAAALANEFVWIGYHEAYLPPLTGIIDRTLTAAALNPPPGTTGLATQITASSGNVANAVATAVLLGVAGKTTYITGFEVTGSGATGALVVTVTVTNTVSGTLSYTYVFVAGATLANESLIVSFPDPIPANAPGVSITVSCPASGLGGTNNTVVAHGFQQ